MDPKALQLFKMLECGDIALSIFKPKAIFLLGMTKRGKTTSGHMLCNQPLRKIQKDGKSIIEPVSNHFLTAEIGQNHDSCTQIPNYFEATIGGQTYVIVDCPGYEDTYGCHRTISNGYFRYRVFSKVESAKFVIVLQYNDFLNDVAGLKKTIISFMQTFKNYDQIENDLLQSTAMLITKVPQGNQIQDLQKMIRKIIKQYENKSVSINTKRKLKNLLRNMADNKKIFKFDEITQNFLVTDTQNTVLRDINVALKSWWKRQKLPNGTVDMSQIQFNILDDVQRNKSNQEYRSQFTKLLSALQFKFKSAFVGGIQLTFNHIIQDSKKNEQSRQFLPVIQSIVAQHYKFDKKFDPQRDQLRRKLFQEENVELNNLRNYQIRKFKIGRLIQTACKQMDLEIQGLLPLQLRSYYFINFVQERIMKILKSIRILSIKKQQIEAVFTKYCYVIFRVLTELKIFFILLNKDTSKIIDKQTGQIKAGIDKNSLDQFPQFIIQIKQALSNIQAIGLKQASMNFILSYKSKKNTDQQAEIKSFMQELYRQDESEKNRIKIKEIQLQISKFFNSNILNSKAEDIFQVLNTMNSSRLFLQKLLLQNSEQKVKQNDLIIENLVQIIKIMGQILQISGNFQLAIICFNSISDVYRVIQVYEIMEWNLNQNAQKRKILIKLAQYAMANCRIEYAITKLQKAYSISKSIAEVKQVSQLIVNYSTMQLGFQARQYILNMIKSGFYKPLSPQCCRQIQRLSINDIKKGWEQGKIKSRRSKTNIFANQQKK